MNVLSVVSIALGCRILENYGFISKIERICAVVLNKNSKDGY